MCYSYFASIPCLVVGFYSFLLIIYQLSSMLHPCLCRALRSSRRLAMSLTPTPDSLTTGHSATCSIESLEFYENHSSLLPKFKPQPCWSIRHSQTSTSLGSTWPLRRAASWTSLMTAELPVPAVVPWTYHMAGNALSSRVPSTSLTDLAPQTPQLYRFLLVEEM